MTYEAWLGAVEAELILAHGVGLSSFPGIDWRALYDFGLTPRAAAEKYTQ